MTESTRTSALASRHRALGSELEDWNGMGTAWSYSTDPNAEHDAVREAAGLFDMSPLKKVYVRGPDAERVVDHAFTRDMTAVAPGHSAYGTVLTERGTICDDAIIANNGSENGNQEFLFCHGSGDSMLRLQESGEGLNVDIELDDDLHDLSLQGPQALPLLDAHADADLTALKYFHHVDTELFGHPCTISRTGYSGERGYEIFASGAVVGDIWDNILERGNDAGVMPASFTALDKVRIEAALLFYGYDMTDDHSPWEVGLGFTVNAAKQNFRGKDAALASRGKERFRLAGLSIDHNDALAGGEKLHYEGGEVGVINSPAWSHRLNRSLALAHLKPELVVPGTMLTVEGEGGQWSARVETIPFFDPEKLRTHAS